MEPFEIILVAVIAVAAVAILIAMASFFYYVLLSPATRIDFLDVSSTHICTILSCPQFVRYKILSGYDGTRITLRAFKNGVELSAMAPVFERTGPPFEEEITFDGLDPRLFDGPGNYELQLSLSGSLGGVLARQRGANPTELTTTYIGLAKGENELPYKFETTIPFVADPNYPDFNLIRPEGERMTLAKSKTIFTAGRGVDSTLYERGKRQDNPVRINCKNTLLKAFILRVADVGVIDQATIDLVRSSGNLGPNDDPIFAHPIDVSMTIVLGDGTTIDLGPLAAIGQVFTLPSPVELTEEIVVQIRRGSGNVPFFPLRPVITEIDALVECVGP